MAVVRESPVAHSRVEMDREGARAWCPVPCATNTAGLPAQGAAHTHGTGSEKECLCASCKKMACGRAVSTPFVSYAHAPAARGICMCREGVRANRVGIRRQ